MIIYFETDQIQLRDIPRVLERMGYSIHIANIQVQAQGFNQEMCDKVTQILRKDNVEYVVSYNFIETISQACMKTDIPYISWVYDDPQQELYGSYAQYPCNYIFVFDKQQHRRLKRVGINNIYHFPLAIDAEKVMRSLLQEKVYEGRYEAEIAFVGQLYRIESLEKIISQADSRVQIAMEKCIERCFLSWDKEIEMHGSMEDCCVQYFSQVDGHKVPRQYPYASEQFYYEAAVLSRVLANRERVTILNSLAEKYDVRFYTFDKDVKGLNKKVKICSGAKYDAEVSNVYYQSKINLNITLHCIETGISQRVFDVMAAGGFLLSNYQEELEELFVLGEDLVVYHNIDELNYYVDYYLTHEEERQRIARNGQKKVLRYHDFNLRMKQVLEIVDKEEKKRIKKYIDILHGDEVEKEMMKDLSLCHNTEIRLGLQQLFEGIETLEDARKKYYEVWMILQVIEKTSSNEDYNECCRIIRANKIPCLFIVWYTYMKKDGKESVLLKLCECMKKYHMATAIELLSYGLVMTPSASALLLKKAECLMELFMWRDALDVLKQIKGPQSDILSLINTLERALNV